VRPAKRRDLKGAPDTRGRGFAKRVRGHGSGEGERSGEDGECGAEGLQGSMDCNAAMTIRN